MDKQEIQRVKDKALQEGFDKLTEDEIHTLKYSRVDENKMIDSDDYTEPQKENMKKRKDKGKKLSPVENAVLKGVQKDKQDEMIRAVVHGYNDLFFKHYDFKEDGVSFDISIREPTIVENGEILAKTSNYIVGMANFVPAYWYNVYHTLALIRVCGESVPVELADDDSMYAPSYDWLVQIGNDFSEWEARFRS